MGEELLIKIVKKIERIGDIGECFITCKDRTIYSVFIDSGEEIKNLEKELPGSQIGVLRKDWKPVCIVRNLSFSSDNKLINWDKIGFGHCSFSEAESLKTLEPVVISTIV